MYESRNTMLSYPVRKELVGKRFLVIEEATIHRRGRNLHLENLSWKAGYIRACSVKDICDKELQVLVEYDGANWEYRQWIKVHENTKAFLAENTIIWAPRTYRMGSGSRTTVSWPALTFVPIVDYLGLSKETKHPIEFFGDKQMAFVKEHEVSQFQDGDERIEQVYHLDLRVKADLEAWQRLQKAQAFLMNGAVTLTGLRVTVYRLQLRQWYTGCITSHNLSTRELHVMDDNVLQTHPENPALVQIDLLADDEELQRILHGEPLKVLPMRKHRPSQIFLQANGEASKPQDGIVNWHMLRELTVSPPQSNWGHPVCHVVNGSNRKNPFVPTAVKEWSEEKKPPSSLPRQKCARRSNRRNSATIKEEPKSETADHCSGENPQQPPSEVQVCKPVPVVVALARSKPTPLRPVPHCARAVSPLTKPKASPLAQASPLDHSPSPIRDEQTPPPAQSSVNKNTKTPPGNVHVVSPIRKQPAEAERPRLSPDNAVVLRRGGDKTKLCNVTASPSESPVLRMSPGVHSVERNLESSPKGKPPPKTHTNNKNVEVTSRHNGYPTKPSEKAIVQEVPVAKFDSSPTQPSSSSGSSNAARPTPSEAATAGVFADQAQARRAQDFSPVAPERGAPLCIHSKTISSMQLQHMLLQKNVAEYQQELIREAMTSLKETNSEQQFFFIADFYHNLLEESRRTNGLYCDVTMKTLEVQQMEHRHHQTEMELISLNHTAQSFSGEVKARLKAAKEAGGRKREELLSFVRQKDASKKKVEDRAEGSHLAGGSGVQPEEEYSKEKQPLQRTSLSQQQQLLKLQQQQQKLQSQQQQQQLLQKQQQQQQVQKKQQQIVQNQQQQLLLQKQQQQHKVRQQNELLKQMQYKQNVLKSSAALASSSEKANARNARTSQQQGTPKIKNPVQTTEAQMKYHEQLSRHIANSNAPTNLISPEQLLATLTSASTLWNVTDNLAMFSGSLNDSSVPTASLQENALREAAKPEVSKNSESPKSNKAKDGESNGRMDNTNSSSKLKSPNGPSSTDTVVFKSGSKEDNVGFSGSSKDKSGSRGDKRKASPSPAQSDSETVTKKKRQRKSRQKKEKNPPESPAKAETPAVSTSNSAHTADGFNTTGSKTPPGFNTTGSKTPPGFNITGSKTPPGFNITGSKTPPGFNITGSKTPPGFNTTGSKTPPGSKAKNGSRATVFATGGAMAVQEMVTTSDNKALLRKVSPVVVESLANDEPSVRFFQPRSITKGIGFVPIKPVGANEDSGVSSSVGAALAAKASSSSSVSSSLDVLASVSASLWTSGGLVPGEAEGKRATPDESATAKAPKKRRERPKKQKKKSGKDVRENKEGKASEVVVMETGQSNGLGDDCDENITAKSNGGVSKNAATNSGSALVKSDEATASPGSDDKQKSKNRSIVSDVESASFAPLSAMEDRHAKKSKNVEQSPKRKGNIVKISRKNLGESSELSRRTKEAAKAMPSQSEQRLSKCVVKKEPATGDFSFVSVDNSKEGGNIDDNCIVFVNDRSIDNVMTIEEIDDNEDNVFKKCLFNRKRQHSQRLNNARLKSGSNEQDKATSSSVSEYGGVDVKIKIEDSRRKEDGGISKKELKVKKRTKIKENSQGNENFKIDILEAVVQPTDIEVAEILIDAVSNDEVGGRSSETIYIAAKLSEEMKVDTKQVEEKEPGHKSKSKSKKKSKDVKKEKKVKEKLPQEEWNYFLQQGDCKTLPTMTHCRECRKDEKGSEEDSLSAGCCRFAMFRRCKKKHEKIEMAGFSCPENAQDEDLQPWVPSENINKIITLETSKYILKNVGDEFCNLVKQEKEAQSWSVKKGRVAWKRAVRGTREMCDACATTIFNVHWVCPKCGFGVCLDCYKFKVHPSTEPGVAKRAKDFRWFSCTPNSSHRPQRMVLVQMIPKQTLFEVGEELHKAREFWGIGENCPCKEKIKELDNEAMEDGVKEKEKKAEVETNQPSQEKLAETCGESSFVGTELGKVKTEIESSKVKTEIESSKVVTETEASKVQMEIESSAVKTETEESSKRSDVEKVLEKITEEVMDTSETFPEGEDVAVTDTDGNEENDDESAIVVSSGIGALSLLMDYESPTSSPVQSPGVTMDTEEGSQKTAEEALFSRPSATVGEPSCERRPSSELEASCAHNEPSVTDELPAPHSWICARPMLRLHRAQHEGNLKAFQSRWEKGEPVLVSYVHENMTSALWAPEGFAEEFGSEKADVVNCKTGGTLEKLEIGTFWRGFESVEDRPLDAKGESILLKLKDWPPEADFVEKMPTRFQDLMKALPLPEYTRRNGSRNLVARLPDFFVKPDLGPKMYNAYGNAAFPSAGTTNLHIDMSDAVNVMVYVGVPKDERYGEQERTDSFKCIGIACDEVQQSRARDPKERLGALWHIFAAKDANKIRALFHKVAKEKNMKYPTNHDPIHDQCFYLDEPLLKRLKEEYGVVGWPIAQFLGDAIFIPAGAPHQVRNLHSCVKVAEDFVSPEHVGHCFHITQEFRHLSDKHTNHEDKLQVKNIIYHAVKDAVSVLRQEERVLESRSEKSSTEKSGDARV